MIIRTTHGFFMIELIITILIITLTSFMFMGYYTKTIIVQKDTELYLQATTLAGCALEKLLSDQTIPTYNQQIDGPFTLKWHITYKSMESIHKAQGPYKDQFVLAEVTIEWQSVLKAVKKISLLSGFPLKAGDT